MHPIIPPVQDSAADILRPFDLRASISLSASERGVLPTTADLLEPVHTIYAIDDVSHRIGHQRAPFLVVDHPAPDLGPREDVPVVQRGLPDLEAGLLEKAPCQRVVGIDPLERRDQRHHVGHPYGIPV
jgi:hypothetical protein